jgi:uncharacterized membrane protein SirB2
MPMERFNASNKLKGGLILVLWGFPFVIITAFLLGVIIYFLTTFFFLKGKSTKAKLIRVIFAIIISLSFFLIYMKNLANLD